MWHRHDQSLLSVLAGSKPERFNLLNQCDLSRVHSAFNNHRIRQRNSSALCPVTAEVSGLSPVWVSKVLVLCTLKENDIEALFGLVAQLKRANG